jgi:hypothetical protein
MENVCCLCFVTGKCFANCWLAMDSRVRSSLQERVFGEPLVSKRLPFLLHDSGFQASCRNIFSRFLIFILSNRVKECSNTSTVTLREVGGDEKESFKSKRVKDDHESQGTRTRGRVRWRGPSAYMKDRPVLSSERTPHNNTTVTVKE